MLAKIALMIGYTVSMFNMLVLNSIRYPENIPHIFNNMEVWLFPDLERARNVLLQTEQEGE